MLKKKERKKKIDKVVAVLNLLLCHEDIRRSGSNSSPFLTSPLDGDEWSAPCPGCFITEEQGKYIQRGVSTEFCT
jgi:hypothetical protein